MAVFWKNHLKDVDFSENALKEVPLGLFQLDVSTITATFLIVSVGKKNHSGPQGISVLFLSL